jgi:AcrR family transcriptional regulator
LYGGGENLSIENQQKPSLRERKKAKTRAIIQQNALRLFREKGYTETTVEQIAEASEVSSSTFFRYFPTKESVVLDDDYDVMLVEEFKKQPKELSPIQACRVAVKAVFSRLPEEEMQAIKERVELTLGVPELRVASFTHFTNTIEMISQIVAERVGCDFEDQAIIVFSGSLVGAMMSVWMYVFKHPESDILEAIDDALALLESGLPL